MTSVSFTSLSHPISVSCPSNLILFFVNACDDKTQQLKKVKLLTKFRLLLRPYFTLRKRLRIYFSITKYFQIILFYLFFTTFFAMFWHGSQYLAPTIVINRYHTPHLNKIFGSYFLVIGKCGVTPHRLYRDSLTLSIFAARSILDVCQEKLTIKFFHAGITRIT